MKKQRIFLFLLALALLLTSCAAAPAPTADVLASTAPVAEIATALLDGTGLTVATLVDQSVSCLHDYSLSARQMIAVQKSALILTNGLELEAFLEDALTGQDVVALCSNVPTICGEAHAHEGEHAHEHEHEGHHHEEDPHIWLSPDNLAIMTQNAAEALSARYPSHADTIRQNAAAYCAQIAAVKEYGEQQLSTLACRSLITFHDGFSYFAQAFDLTIAAAIEVEAGSEPPAKELAQIVTLVRGSAVPAIFVERNGNTDAANVISRETGVAVFSLDMGMETGALAAIRHNIDTIKEALG